MANFEYAETWKRKQSRFLAEVVAQTESPLEALFASALLTESDGGDGYAITDLGLAQMTPQREVVVGDKTYRIDFAIEVRDIMKVAVEIDGHDAHQATEEMRKATRQRSSDLELDGWEVIHFHGHRVSKAPRECAAASLDVVRQVGLIWEARRWQRIMDAMGNNGQGLVLAGCVRWILYYYCQNPWLLDEPSLHEVEVILPANAALVVAAERQSLRADGSLDAGEFFARCPAFFATAASEYVDQGRLLPEEDRGNVMASVTRLAGFIPWLRADRSAASKLGPYVFDIGSVMGAAKEAHNGRGLDVLRRTHETYVDRLRKLDGEVDRLERLAKDLVIHDHA